MISNPGASPPDPHAFGGTGSFCNPPPFTDRMPIGRSLPQTGPSRRPAPPFKKRVVSGPRRGTDTTTQRKTMECPVCYESLEASPATTTVCGHAFHTSCLGSWLERATTCPACRTKIAEAPTNPESEQVWLAWFEERRRVVAERIAANRARLQAIEEGLEAIKADMAAHEAARKAKRSASAKKGAATRAANRAARMTCN